ncbi:MAG: hypothetical protein HY828_14510 [Actinobacteria bacterium]|nr:hypothetical protein [Actinomycetota bacterium]
MSLRRATPTAHIARWLRTGGFRQIDLNIAGWTAVLAPGAAVGLVSGILLDQVLLIAVPAGLVCSWLVAVSIDRWRWSRSECGYDISDLSPQATDDLTARLTSDGIRFRVAVETFEQNQPCRILHAQMRGRRHIETCIDDIRAM